MKAPPMPWKAAHTACLLASVWLIVFGVALQDCAGDDPEGALATAHPSLITLPLVVVFLYFVFVLTVNRRNHYMMMLGRHRQLDRSWPNTFLALPHIGLVITLIATQAAHRPFCSTLPLLAALAAVVVLFAVNIRINRG